MSDNFEKWEKIGDKPIGQGGFGVVWKVRTDKGSVLAAKYIDMKFKEVKLQMLKREVDILKQLSHENIVRFVATNLQEDNQLIVFTEFIEGSDLASLGRLDESRAVDLLRQICEGVKYLHTRKPPVLHCDLKGENIMVTKRDQVKIIDFGVSINLMVASGMKVTTAVTQKDTLLGTIPFMAPECFLNNELSVKSDVWAIGITVYQMMVGQPPFSGLSNTAAIIEEITSQGSPPLPVACSQNLAKFYTDCTAFNPRDRPPVRELLNCQIFSE